VPEKRPKGMFNTIGCIGIKGVSGAEEHRSHFFVTPLSLYERWKKTRARSPLAKRGG